LVKVELKRFLTIIEITLTLNPTDDQKKAVGYQAPIVAREEDLLTKEKWEKQEAERKERIATRG
jgi:hypothetical protein